MKPPTEREKMKDLKTKWEKGIFSLEISQTIESRLDELTNPRDVNEWAEKEFLRGRLLDATRVKRTTRCTEAGTFTFIEPNYSEVAA
jgi:hypothetical protein